tara:strand:+ start:819 stop:3572 length:2754 start_codon:yes stop_codon:yes gene_type:complete
MKSMKLLVLTIFVFHTLFAYNQTFTFQQSILSSTDDAEEKFDGSYITTSSSDLEMMYDSWNSQGIQTVGLRFDNITIPANATIANAYIQFTADGSSSGNVAITIKGEDIAYSSTFSNSSNNISSRNTTSTNIVWNPSSSWIDNASGLGQRTTDLSTIVSEVITSNGWQIGNPITFILTGNGNSSDFREAYSFDGNSSKSAQLVIEYNPNLNIDLALTSINSPSNSIYPNSSSLVEVEILNYGNINANSYNVTYSINGILTATETVNIPLSIGQSTTFSFNQTADLTSLGNYVVAAEVTINNDQDTLNNILYKTISVVNELDSLLFNQGSSWLFLDSGINPGSSWKDSVFNDSLWPVGIGHFGFGDGDEQTVLNNGLDCYYFRKKVNIPNINEINDVYFHMIHDDGAVLYINGQEATRTEMVPLGTIGHFTNARQSCNSTNENNFYTYKISSNLFVNGINTIAVSLHNSSNTDSDISFDCFVTSTYLHDHDGPYVYYNGSDVLVKEVTPNGLIINTYNSVNGLQLSCQLPHMGTSFSFNLKPQINIEPSVYPLNPSKFLSISDFDGHIEGFTMILRGEGVIDSNFNWTYGDGHLIISGDLFDRGFHITECMWLLYKLESEAANAGGKVHLIIGNHEIMNMTDDWRYVEVKYFNNAHLMGKRMSELYGSNTELGRWLRSKNIIEKVGDYAFMHGGISPQLSAFNLTYDQINDYGRQEMNGIPCSNAECTVVNGSSGIYWFRGMAYSLLTQIEVDSILSNFGVKRVVIGHTKDNTIRSLYNDKVMAIDMYHVDNFNNGYMEGLQFELGCFYLFHTDGVNSNYNQIGNCDSLSSNLVEINKDGHLKIYPNPSTGILNLEIPNNKMVDYKYSIVDILGKIVTKGDIKSNITTIDIGRFSDGKYVLNLQNYESIISGYFIIKH